MKTFPRRIPIAVFVGFLAVTALRAQSPADERWTIRPGEAIGPIEIGMSSGEVRSAAGEPGEVTSEGIWWTYPDPGVRAVFPISGEILDIVLQLSLSDRRPGRVRPRTVEGIGLGSTTNEVTAAFGAADTRHDDGETVLLDYASKGIRFTVRDDRVAEITVFQPYRPRTKQP